MQLRANITEHCTFFFDAEEPVDGKWLIVMAQTSLKLTNGSPKLGKPLAGLGRSEAGPKPHWFPWASLPKPRSTPGLDIAVGVSTTLCYFCPRCSEPACWHGARPRSLTNRPSKETWMGRPVFPLNCHESWNWQLASAGGGRSTLLLCLYLVPSVYSMSSLF